MLVEGLGTIVEVVGYRSEVLVTHQSSVVVVYRSIVVSHGFVVGSSAADSLKTPGFKKTIVV